MTNSTPKFNEGQTKVRAKLLQIVEDGVGQILINSPAGVGKTWVAMATLSELVWNRLQDALNGEPEARGIRVLICAPTHSAKKTLSKKLDKEVQKWIVQLNQMGFVSEILFTTTSSALNLRLETNLETGEAYLKKGFGTPKLFRHWDLIIVDEISLLNKRACAIIQFGMDNGVLPPSLLMGDSFQLPPVKESLSQIFSIISEENQLVLDEQMRCQGPIEIIASKARGNVYYPEKGDGKNVFVFPHIDGLIQSACESFKEAFDNGVDYSTWSFLTFTNKKALQAAQAIRKAMYNSTADYIEGEWLRVKSGVSIGDNSDLVQILSVSPTEKLGYKAWNLEIKNHDNDEIETVSVLAFESQEAFNHEVNHLQEMGNQAKRESRFEDARGYWEERQVLQNSFSVLNYSVSMSVHWSQGCTFQRAWVDTKSISKASNKAQLLYVAYSRAAERLYAITIYQYPSKPELLQLLADNGLTPHQARDKNNQEKGIWRLRPNSWLTLFLTAVDLGLQPYPH